MEENTEKKEEVTDKKVETNELKSEASNTVNQVKETIKKVDIKKDSMETTGFVTELFKDPLGKIKEIVTKDTGKFLTYAIIILVIWCAAKLISSCFSAANLWGFSYIGSSILLIIKSLITPILEVLVMSIIIFAMNKKNKKALITVITAVIVANVPTVISSVVSLLTIISAQVSYITTAFAGFCSLITTILMYFAMKSMFGTEKNSDFIKTFVAVEGIYYIVYFILSFLGIYI